MDDARRRAANQARVPDGFELSEILDEALIASEVQQIEVLSALAMRVALAGYCTAQQLDQHSFVRYGDLTEKGRCNVTDYPHSLRVKNNVYVRQVKRPFDVTILEHEMTKDICALLQQIRIALGGDQQVVWTEPLVYTERLRQGHFRCNVWLVLRARPLELDIPM